MLASVAAIIGGFLILIWGADRFVAGAAATARNLGMPTLVIGLTIVGFGTSAPEILVAAMASLSGNPGLAIGNALGSNIANIGLILGTAALIAPMTVRSETLKREYPLLIAVSLLAWWLSADGHLGLIDGVILLSCLFASLYWIVWLGLHSRASDPMLAEYQAEIPDRMSMPVALGWLLVGLLLLLASSRLLVWGAVNVAQVFGVSDLVIGLTIVAIGTSLPELAASVVAALKNEHDIAIGNIIGSNLYNLLAVFSLPGILHPGRVDDVVIYRDFPIMMGFTAAMFVMAYGFRGHGRINRIEATALLLGFIAYQTMLFVTAQA